MRMGDFVIASRREKMNDLQPNDLKSMEGFLTHYGINIGFLLSGFFGTMMMVSKNSSKKLGQTIAAILAGTACANYITPVMMHFLPSQIQTNGKYAVAFAMGFMGLKGLELLIDRYFTGDQEEQKPNRRTSSTKKRNTPKKSPTRRKK